MNTKYKIQNTKYQSGFTIVELLIVIAITVIMASIGSMTYFGFRERERVDQMANRIAADMRATMARAQAQEGGNQWGMHFDNVDSSNPFYAIWYGATSSTYGSGSTTFETVTLVATGLKFTAPAAGLSTDIIFTKPYGLPSASATITITSTAAPASSRTISIDTNGNITY
jgi:prepilin-type N-terminal cleavage/methylation domain-containing protein